VNDAATFTDPRTEAERLFPCAQCGADVHESKLQRGPDFVFCKPSCNRQFWGWVFKGGKNRVDGTRLLSAYLRAAKYDGGKRHGFSRVVFEYNLRMYEAWDKTGSFPEPEPGFEHFHRRDKRMPPDGAPPWWDHLYEVMRERASLPKLELDDVLTA
jgi:hypothetical protein